MFNVLILCATPILVCVNPEKFNRVLLMRILFLFYKSLFIAAKHLKFCIIIPIVSIQIIPVGLSKQGMDQSLSWWIKIAVACLRIILRDESQVVNNIPLHSSSPTLNPTNQSIRIWKKFIIYMLFIRLFFFSFIH